MPLEWFALSAGAKIAMDSGSENLDWVARVLRRLVEHTQRSLEVNVVVAGINVGAQPYWNAEATMLMHTSGILVMTPDSAMVLTGKQAIDYSGGVSAEDNLGIGGYARIMGPNGEAQYFAPTIGAAVELLQLHYRLTYRAPGERWPQRIATADPFDRDVSSYPHAVEGSEFHDRRRDLLRRRRIATARSRSTSARSSAPSSTPTTRSSSGGRRWPKRRRPWCATRGSADTP